MQGKFDILSKDEKISLIRLSVFGISETSLVAVMNFFGLKSEEEKNNFLEFIYKINSLGWIELNKNTFQLTSQAKEYIYATNPPQVSNSGYIIEQFLGLLSPTDKPEIDQHTEMLLLGALRNIRGVSANLALLNDYYAQYLSSFENHKSAVDFFNLAIEIQTKVNENDVNLCNFYNHLSEAHLSLNQQDDAIRCAFKSQNISQRLSASEQIISVYTFSLISTIYYRKKEYQKAYGYILQAIEIAEIQKLDNQKIASLYYETSIIAVKTDNLLSAEKYINKAIEIVNKINKNEDNFKELVSLQKQYVISLKKIDKSPLRFAKNSYLLIVFAVIVAIILSAIFIF